MGKLDFINISLFLAFSLNLGLGLIVYLKESLHRRVNISFSILLWALAGWAFSILMIFLFEEAGTKLFWLRMSYAISSYIPSAFLYFSTVFPNEKRSFSPLKVVLISSFSSIFAILSFTGWVIRSANWETLTLNYGLAHRLFSIFFILSIAAGIVLLSKSFKASLGLERLQIKYCLLGMFVSAILGVFLSLILPYLGTSRLSKLGPPSTLIMVFFITYSILKHNLMDINIVLKKGTTYILLSLALFVPSFFLILFSQEVFFSRISYLFSVVILAMLFLVTLIFYRIKPHTERVVEQVLFRNRYDYRETLADFSKAMVSILDLQSLSRRIFETITETMRVEKASLLLWNEEKAGYSLSELKNVVATNAISLIPKDDPLPQYLQKMAEIIVREELAKGAQIPQLKGVVNKMSLLQAELTIPFISKGQLVGMMNLGYKFTKDIYSHEDIELLSTLANQTAIAIENARLYEDLKRSKSYIRRADRLASLGTLTAGLAHEIRNPLVAIKTLTQLLPERLEDEEFRSQFLKIASGEVDRISSLVNELLDFARPSDPKWALEDVNAILDGMILLVSTGTKKKLINIIKNYAANLPPAQIDREQIKQVVLNILLNAIDATAENGTITVQTRSFIKPGGEPYIQIEFTDTGCGIPSEHLEDIFNPFFTTKPAGSGLGLSISNQIIQDHKGYIDVESQLEKGSSFFINLPIRQNHPKGKMRNSEDSQNTPTALRNEER